MAHTDHIWPALACLRRGELPSPAEVDALVALARGEAQAPKQPRLFAADDTGDALARAWCAAYEVEFCCAPPALPPSAHSALRGAERDMPGASRFYGWFFRWIQSAGKESPKWAASISPQPAKFRARLAEVAAWAGPRIAQERRVEQHAEAVAAVGERPPELCGRCEPPPGGFAALLGGLAKAKSWNGGGE